tara:strand:+ start:6199 stop:7041 length:843 start_codon:yes stop_codon:yes gene_type:complete
MKKGGQVSVLIIVAIVIVGAIGIYFTLENFTDVKKLDFNSRIEIVRGELLECFNLIYQDSLDLVGAQGGYYNEPFGNYEVQGENVFIPYYKDDDNFYLPSIKLIESELGIAVDSTLDYCFKTVSFNNLEFNIYFSEPNTNAIINEKDVSFVTLVNMNIALENQTSFFEFNEEKIILSSLKGMHNIADYYLYQNLINEDSIPADGIAKIAEEEDVFVDITHHSKGVLMVSIFPLKDSSYPQIFNFLDSPKGIKEEKIDQEEIISSIVDDDEELEDFEWEEL